MEFTDKSKTVSQIFGGLGIAGSILEILEKGRSQENASQAAAQAVPHTSESPAPSVKTADGYWTCPKCGKQNEWYSRVCNDCAYVR